MNTAAGTVAVDVKHHDRHWLRPGLLAHALAVAVYGAVYVLTVEPLGPGGVWYAQGFTRESPIGFPTFPPKQVIAAGYVPNGTVVFGFGVRNATLFPLTVTDLPNPWNGRFILRQISVGHEERGSSVYARPLPFTLASGQQTILVVTAQFHNCSDWPGGVGTYLPLDVTMLAIPHRVNFPLPYQVQLKGADACS